MRPGHLLPALVLLAVPLGSAAPSRAATPLAEVTLSPDVAILLQDSGSVYVDEDAIEDDLGGFVMTADLGPLPSPSDVSGYAPLAGGDRLLCFDTAVELTGVVASPGDVVRYDGVDYTIEFAAAANFVPRGVLCDALTVDGAGGLVLSFDTSFLTRQGFVAEDEDLVRVEGPGVFSLFFDGSTAGIPAAVDVDGAHLLPGGNVLLSLDTAAVVDRTHAEDEDLLEFDPVSTTWSLAFDADAHDAAWSVADTDAIAVPEPGGPLLLFAGLLGLGALARREPARARREASGARSPAQGDT